MPSQLKLRVTGMSCGGCENAVKRAVSKLTGVTGVTASHADQRVEVSFEGDLPARDAVVKAIETIGYRVVE